MIARRYLILKDKKYRNRYSSAYKKNAILKIKLFISSPLKKIRIKRKIQRYETKASRIRNYCLLTGKARSVYQDFRLSRHMVRKLANSGD